MENFLKFMLKAFLICSVIACGGLKMNRRNNNLVGHVFESKFNSMPEAGAKIKKGTPVSTFLYFYEPTTIKQIEDGMMGGSTVKNINTRLIDSVQSDKLGAFKIYLKPGKYSVFIKYENGYYIPFFSGSNWVSIIEVKAHGVNNLDFNIRSANSFE